MNIKKNASPLDEMITWAEELNVGRFYVSHLLYSGRGQKMAEDDLSPAETRKTLFNLFEKALTFVKEDRSMGIVTGSNDSDGVLLYNWIKNKFGDSSSQKIFDFLAGFTLWLFGDSK